MILNKGEWGRFVFKQCTFVLFQILEGDYTSLGHHRDINSNSGFLILKNSTVEWSCQPPLDGCMWIRTRVVVQCHLDLEGHLWLWGWNALHSLVTEAQAFGGGRH